MTIAFAFPGQGSERPGMCLDIIDADPPAKRWTALASELTGIDVRRAIECGDPKLMQTSVLQPALVAVSLAVDRALRERGVLPARTAGHSLGELAAATSAGWLTPEDAIRLAAVRGASMQRAADANPGGMIALSGPASATFMDALESGPTVGRWQLAARNAPDEVVLTGDRAAIDAIAAKFGATRLPVSGPWHSAAMGEAAAALGGALDAALARTQRSIAGPVWHSGLDGAPRSDAAEVREALTRALVRPVEWVQLIDAWIAAGVTDVVVVGPAKVVRGLVRRCAGDRLRVHACDRATDVDRLANGVHRGACGASGAQEGQS